MMNQYCHFLLPLFTFYFFLLLFFTTTLAKSPAPAPARPHNPTNVINILWNAGKFKTFIRLLNITQLDSNLNSQLGNSNNGLTIFAPSDIAFSSLKIKQTLRSLTHQQLVELMQFHIVPTFISTFQFDTVTNPLKTHAGSGDRFLLIVTTDGNSVKISTGLTNTTIDKPVYSDNHLAIYEVHKVLLPLDIFTPKPPPPKLEPDEEEEDDDDEDDENAVKDKSDAVSFDVGCNLVLFGLIGVISAVFCF
ncbi:fasciclin-like arabinogalactan protein 12 [Euphorbia lathyris]|uniref:fasciclin-like arabinogalactan protein 12 n=1 Tax=Euphorbia lathyris TaxID=212925 RepID=UPI003313F766